MERKKNRSKIKEKENSLIRELTREKDNKMSLIEDSLVPAMSESKALQINGDIGKEIDELEELYEKKSAVAKLLAVERIIELVPYEQDISRLAMALRELKTSDEQSGAAPVVNNFTTYLQNQINNIQSNGSKD